MRGEGYLTKQEQFALVYEKGNSWVNDLVVVRGLIDNENLYQEDNIMTTGINLHQQKNILMRY